MTRTKVYKSIMLVFISLSAGGFLRLYLLGNVFQSSDNAELAVRVLENRGLLWMFLDNYGFLINLTVGSFAHFFSILNITLSEFIWKLPVAFIGIVSLPVMGVLVAKKYEYSYGLLIMLFFSVHPLHVMQSRYPWGYEIFGALFSLLALHSFFRFLEEKTIKTGLQASFVIGVYMLSHGYFLPFAVVLFGTSFIFQYPLQRNLFKFILPFIQDIKKYYLWLFPVLLSPAYFYPLKHALKKRVKPGFYLFDHFEEIVGNLGIGLFCIVLIGFFLFLRNFKAISSETKSYMFAGICYFLPLIFLSQPGLTVVRGYFLVGSVFFTLASLILFWKYVNPSWLKYSVLILVFASSLWGTWNSVFLRDQGFDPSFTKKDRGTVDEDPGTKTFGFIYQEYFPHDEKVLVLHRNIEPPNIKFYVNTTRCVSFYDKTLEETEEIFHESGLYPIVVADKGQSEFVDNSAGHKLEATVSSEGVKRLYIYSQIPLSLPKQNFTVELYNPLFDQKYLRKLR
jgi:hypothetical protein